MIRLKLPTKDMARQRHLGQTIGLKLLLIEHLLQLLPCHANGQRLMAFFTYMYVFILCILMCRVLDTRHKPRV